MMNDDVKFFVGAMLFFIVVGVLMAGAVKSTKINTCRDFQALYGDVVELETGWLTARCTIGDYTIDNSINDHLYIREYLND